MRVDEQAEEPASVTSEATPDATPAATAAPPAATQELAPVSDARDEVRAPVHVSHFNLLMHVDEQAEEPATAPPTEATPNSTAAATDGPAASPADPRHIFIEQVSPAVCHPSPSVAR